MKKILTIIILLCLPCLIFAEFQLGAAAFYNIVVPPEAITGIPAAMTIDDFTFGADARFKLNIFQVSGLALFSPGAEEMPAEMEVFLDAGIALDFLLLRLGIGAGPNLNFILDSEAPEMVQLGGNIKLNTEIRLGKLAFGLSYLMFLESFSTSGVGSLLDYVKGNLGIYALYELF